MNFNAFLIKKKKGSFRKIYAPKEALAKKLKNKLSTLEEIHKYIEAKYLTSTCCYSFIKGRSVVDAAYRHIGYNYNISFDLEDFFESITPAHCRKVFNSYPNIDQYQMEELLKLTFLKDSLPQGFPTSPLISNISMIPFDRELTCQLRKLKHEVISYTRYADDLSISFDNISSLEAIIKIVERLITKYHLKENRSKRNIQNAKNGLVIIYGVGVSMLDLHATRRTKKKLRAALHQKRYQSAIGLNEWIKHCERKYLEN